MYNMHQPAALMRKQTMPLKSRYRFCSPTFILSYVFEQLKRHFKHREQVMKTLLHKTCKVSIWTYGATQKGNKIQSYNSKILITDDCIHFSCQITLNSTRTNKYFLSMLLNNADNEASANIIKHLIFETWHWKYSMWVNKSEGTWHLGKVSRCFLLNFFFSFHVNAQRVLLINIYLVSKVYVNNFQLLSSATYLRNAKWHTVSWTKLSNLIPMTILNYFEITLTSVYHSILTSKSFDISGN